MPSLTCKKWMFQNDVCVCVCVCVFSLLSRVQLFCDPMDWSPLGFSVQGISQVMGHSYHGR